VGRPHGLKGEVTVVADTDHPGRFEPDAVFLTADSPPRELVLISTRRHHGALLASFVGVEDREHAAELQGAVLTIDTQERRTLSEGEFWPDDLQGLAALDHNGDKIGTVTGVVLGEAQDRLVITTTDGDLFELPFVDELVGEVHPSGGFVVILPPQGLLPEQG